MEYDSIFDEIHQKIAIVDVLIDYGYHVGDYGERTQSFSCDLHGDGRDTRPSAVVYPETGSFYCFACGTQRDSIDLVRIKEDLSFVDAVKHLVDKYKITLESPLRPKNSVLNTREFKPRVADPLPILDYEATQLRVERLLSGLIHGNSVLGWRNVWLVWGEADRWANLVRRKKLTPEQASLHLMALHKLVMEKLQHVPDRQTDPE